MFILIGQNITVIFRLFYNPFAKINWSVTRIFTLLFHLVLFLSYQFSQQVFIFLISPKHRWQLASRSRTIKWVACVFWWLFRSLFKEFWLALSPTCEIHLNWSLRIGLLIGTLRYVSRRIFCYLYSLFYCFSVLFRSYWRVGCCRFAGERFLLGYSASLRVTPEMVWCGRSSFESIIAVIFEH